MRQYNNTPLTIKKTLEKTTVRARTHGVENLPNNTIICQIFVLFAKYHFYLGTLFAHVNAA